MKFNADKFECLRYWPGNRSVVPDLHYTAPDGTRIEEKETLRDLGVEISADLTFNIHIVNITTAASKLVGWALRTFGRRSKALMLNIWKSLIQPKLDYCSQLWSPSDQASIALLEGVQRSFTARIEGEGGKDYWDRLIDLGLYSQERRRERYQIIFVWKLSQGLAKGYSLNFNNDARRGRIAVEKNINWKSCAAVQKARQASFAVKGPKLFNLLPRAIRDIDSNKVEVFKNKLDKYLSSVVDQPTISTRNRAAETNSLIHQIPMLRNTNG